MGAGRKLSHWIIESAVYLQPIKRLIISTSLSTQTLLVPASGASKGLRILQDFGKVVCSCSTPIYNGHYKTNFWVPNVPPYILTHNVELTTLIHKIIVSIVASAHGLRYDHINVFQGVGATLLNSGILSRLGVYQPGHYLDRKSTRLNSSHPSRSRMPASAWKKKKKKDQPQ